MSQNQSYFWQTTRHNVYLKRSAKFHILMAMMAVLSFSTVCLADFGGDADINGLAPVGPSILSAEGKQIIKQVEPVEAATNEIPTVEPTKITSKLKAGGFVDAFTASLSVILFTELGDKTFFIAAIMAMRHPRLIVFTGAITALALMTVLSVFFGMAATIIPKVYTYYISTALFAIFGLKMIYDGWMMKPGDAQEEMEEVQSDLRKREDELLRATRGKYEDTDTKRKNSNSDKEEDDGGVNGSAGAAKNVTISNAEIKHRKQLNKSNNNNIKNKNGCEPNNEDDHDETGCNETDVFLDGENIKMSNIQRSSVASNASNSFSNQKNIKNCDEFSDSSTNFKQNSGDTQHKQRGNLANGGGGGGTALVHSASAGTLSNNTTSSPIVGGIGGSTTSITHGASNHSLNSITVVQANGELKQVGGNKKRLERDVSATLVQDPESGIVRKNSKKSASYFTMRILMQAFTMTFLAEWGDRSQLTTIILAASKNVYGIVVGGILGHSICTGLAVIGGRFIAAKISVRTVTIMGGIVFLGFAVYALIATPDDL